MAMAWQFNRKILVFGLVAMLGILQFVVSVCCAINIYPDGYSITGDFLSDLGETVTPYGKNNAACAALFNRSVIVLGISLIPFFSVMPSIFHHGRIVLGVAGVLSAIGLIGIGLTPYNNHSVAHLAALGLWLVSMLVTVATFVMLIKLHGSSSMTLSLTTLSVVVAVGAYALAGSHSGHVVFQKVAATLAVIWFCCVFVIVSISTFQAISSRHQVVEEQARAYIKVLERNYRRR